MKRKTLIFATAALMLAFAFTSCEETDTVTNPLAETSIDDDEVTTFFDDVLAETDELTLNDTKEVTPDLTSYLGSGTRTVETTFSGDTMIKTVTYNNFVNGNSQMERVKNGQVIMKVIRHQYPGEFKRIITMNQFTINGNAIEGKRQMVRSEADPYQFNITLEGGKVTFSDGRVYTRECTHTRTMIEGMTTFGNIWDDVYTVEGLSTGTNCDGETYTHTIQNALMHKLSCRWIVEGTIGITVGEKNATFDYGDGTCDNIATVTANGETIEIKLRGGL